MAAQYAQEMQQYFRANSKTREFPAHTAKVHSVAWSCDGRRLASGSFDKTASVFVLDKDRLMKENNYRGHGDSVDQLCWHPSNPDLFVTASGDKTVRIWDVRSEKCLTTVNTKAPENKRANDEHKGVILASASRWLKAKQNFL